MDSRSVRLRAFSKLVFECPNEVLEHLNFFDAAFSNSNLEPRIKHLRTNSLKAVRERRDAAIFCIGIESVLKTSVRFSQIEEQDYDFVATWQSKEGKHYCPVQLKELVSSELNPSHSMQDIMNGLSKYIDSTDLTVAVKFSRVSRFEPSSLQIPESLRISGLWVFGAISEDQLNWGIWGNFTAGSINEGISYQIPR